MTNRKDRHAGGADPTLRNPWDNELPWGARFILFLVALALAASMIVLPIWSVQQYGATSGSDLWGPMLAMLIGLTTMTISGIFVFMTFRIDRGTKLTAQWTARRIAADTVEKLVKRVVGEKIAEARKKIDGPLSEVAGETKAMGRTLTAARARFDAQFAAADREMKEMNGKIEAAKRRIDDQFATLDGQVGDLFSKVKDQMEESLLAVNVEELIKKAVDVHISGADKKNGGTEGSE